MNATHYRRSRYITPSLIVAISCFAAPILQRDALRAEDDPRVSETCLDCHEDYDAGLLASPHRLSTGDLDDPNARVACSDCHPGDERHYEEDPEEYPRANPARLAATDAAVLCTTCHTNSHQQSMLEGNVHVANDVNCSGCHKVHENSGLGLLKAPQTTLCLGCHTSIEGQFARPYRHPVNDQIVTCSECHKSLDVTSRELSLTGTNAPCVGCHVEFQGPFPFEHQATLDFSTEGGGCLSCHDPHGSYLPRMLKQPYEPPHYQLCSQCHSVPLHNNNLNHGTEWAGVACNECHTDIHGSYVSRHFLSESLESQGCFNAGCHEY